MFRYLASPENFRMVGVHGLPADVFMMARTIWEVSSFQWELGKKYFENGRGLDGNDFEQVTHSAAPRTQRPAELGILLLVETVPTIYNDICPDDQFKRFINTLGVLVCEGLQTEQSTRPTMTEMKDRVRELWQLSHELGSRKWVDDVAHTNRAEQARPVPTTVSGVGQEGGDIGFDYVDYSVLE